MMYCNMCAVSYEPAERSQRFCSLECSSRHVNLTRTERTPNDFRRRELMDILRACPGEWVDRQVILRRMYGLCDAASAEALTMVVSRLRRTADGMGIVIEVRRRKRPFDIQAHVSYRLIQDAEPADEIERIVGLAS